MPVTYSTPCPPLPSREGVNGCADPIPGLGHPLRLKHDLLRGGIASGFRLRSTNATHQRRQPDCDKPEAAERGKARDDDHCNLKGGPKILSPRFVKLA